jgi:hypothetical protein
MAFCCIFRFMWVGSLPAMGDCLCSAVSAEQCSGSVALLPSPHPQPPARPKLHINYMTPVVHIASMVLPAAAAMFQFSEVGFFLSCKGCIKHAAGHFCCLQDATLLGARLTPAACSSGSRTGALHTTSQQ